MYTFRGACRFVLGKRAGDLAHHLAAKVVAVSQVVAGGREQPDAALG